MVFAARENGIGTGACYEETIALFPSSHGMGIDRATLIVTFEEVRFHWKDSKMGDKTGNI